MSSQQTGDIEFCLMTFIFTSYLAHAVQVSPGSTVGISNCEMRPDDAEIESETLLESGHSVFNDELQIACNTACNDNYNHQMHAQRTRSCAIL